MQVHSQELIGKLSRDNFSLPKKKKKKKKKEEEEKELFRERQQFCFCHSLSLVKMVWSLLVFQLMPGVEMKRSSEEQHLT